ncbi:glycoside hydrolase family 13 protein [Salinivirga cyanobacteriivorans]|nr:glycoside hydrolase family 13 protein [Salinivirga cyanobacteriivorans]
MKYLLTIVTIMLMMSINAQDNRPSRVEPPNWWVGMENNQLQLLVYGADIGKTNPEIEAEEVSIEAVHKVENSNYLFIDLNISKSAKAGEFSIKFNENGKTVAKYEYELREKTTQNRGFSAADLIYLVMPDRFANGNPGNDDVDAMLEKADRSNPNGRHGGDLQGIMNNLDYIKDLGMTAIWVNPFFENNMKDYSYHGYAITDFYKTDPRLGSNELYKNLVETSHEKNMKVVMDVVVNHCGINHWWMKDLPTDDWINNHKKFQTNYRGSVIADPHASKYDRNRFSTGWFVETMPDLNQNNPFLANYLIQNMLWWIEFSGIDGMRMDTQPYAEIDFVTRLAKRITEEYPDFTILGETWLQKVALTAFFQQNSPVAKDYNSHIPTNTDFPLYYAIKTGLNQEDGWTTGLAQIYYVLARDFLYNDAHKNVIFLDNHDLDRFYSSVGEDINKFKMGIGILLTMRGIPMMYYGDEILMTGLEHTGHGNIRKDFPGGWDSDKRNAFTEQGRTDKENEGFNFVRKLAKWRMQSNAVAEGELTHFVPENNTYVYFRHTDNEAVMVILNNHPEESRTIDGARFKEVLDRYGNGKNVMTGETVSDKSTFTLKAKSVKIIEFKK